MKIEEAIEQINGMTEDQIAELLKKNSIKGDRGDAQSCALHEYFVAVADVYGSNLVVTTRHVRVARNDHVDEFLLAQAATDFIHDFDGGYYPELAWDEGADDFDEDDFYDYDGELIFHSEPTEQPEIPPVGSAV